MSDRGARSDLDNRRRAALAAFLDTLIPGDADWPPASRALDDPEVVPGLAEADRGFMGAAAEATMDLSGAARVEAMRSLEAQEPEAFARVLRALYDAYYTTALASAQVRRLAEASPREPSPHFDPALLDRVVATQAGRRRF